MKSTVDTLAGSKIERNKPMELNMNEKKKKKTEYCPNCRRQVNVEGGSGFLQAIIGTLGWFLGGVPGARESKPPRCTICHTEIIYV